MRAYVRLTGDSKITDRPCRLYSVTMTTEGGGPGKAILYDGYGAESGFEIATLLCGGNASIQFRWDGLELTRGLYVDFVEKVDYVTIEWEPWDTGG